MQMNYNLILDTELTSMMGRTLKLSHKTITLKVGIQLNKINIFSDASNIIFDLRNLETIELSSIQKIMTLCNKYRKDGKEIVLIGKDKPGYKHIYRIFHMLRPDQKWLNN